METQKRSGVWTHPARYHGANYRIEEGTTDNIDISHLSYISKFQRKKRRKPKVRESQGALNPFSYIYLLLNHYIKRAIGTNSCSIIIFYFSGAERVPASSTGVWKRIEEGVYKPANADQIQTFFWLTQRLVSQTIRVGGNKTTAAVLTAYRRAHKALCKRRST